MTVPEEVLVHLTEFNRWKSSAREGADYDLLDYVASRATPDLLFGFAALFSPSLVLHEGDYFLASHFSEKLYEEWKARLPDIQEVQKVMNHIHISTLFQDQEVPDLIAQYAAKTIQSIWSTVLSERHLVAEAYGDGLSDAQVTFFRRA